MKPLIGIHAQAQAVVRLKQGASESVRTGSITARKRLELTFVVPEMRRQPTRPRTHPPARRNKRGHPKPDKSITSLSQASRWTSGTMDQRCAHACQVQALIEFSLLGLLWEFVRRLITPPPRGDDNTSIYNGITHYRGLRLCLTVYIPAYNAKQRKGL